MPNRRLHITPPDWAATVVTCEKTIFIQAELIPVADWVERLPVIDGWVVAVYAEDETSAWLHTALSRMWSSPSVGGLWRNLKRARDADVLYEVEWGPNGLQVALCDKDPALEGGLGNLIEGEQQFGRGMIPTPPAIAVIRRLHAELPEVDAIMLPASPKESNELRFTLVRVILIRPEVLARVNRKEAVRLRSRLRLLRRLITHRAPDRTAALEDPPGRKLWVAPRLLYTLGRLRLAHTKDWLRRVFIDKPKASCSSVRDFLRDQPMGSAELLRAVGYLIKSLLEGWAAVLFALAAVITALSQAGLL